ncbi:MAG TPA: RimK family alpha-L-glutamate ligase [Solirubrobacteraceae bacterium]|nr:RimK family alpha-L-glutamate ligase [Solirubrobacteraceae bacterium]
MTALRVGVLGATGSWHSRRLLRSLAARGHECVTVPATRLRAQIGADGTAAVLGPGGERLDALDVLIVRGLPRGSLEQVIFRMDALHALADHHGVRCVNGPRAIERTIDKSWCSALLAAAGVSTPPTIVCERREDAMRAFETLGSDVVVKPLFGAMGAGIARIQDPDVAHRVFGALELERAVYYLQRAVDGPDRRDLRALVIGGDVVGAMERVASSWRANVARGGRPRPVSLTDAQRDTALAAAAAVGAEVAGVDLLADDDGGVVVPEVNGIPGWQALQSVCDVDLTEAVVDAVVGS